MNIAYLAHLDPEKAAIVEGLKAQGHQITCTNSVNEAEGLLKERNCDFLLYEWPFTDKLKWIRRRFPATERNPNLTVEKFLVEFRDYFTHHRSRTASPPSQSA